MRVRVAVLASGRGSNFEAILSSVEAGRLDVQIVALISDTPDAPVLEKAHRHGIPAFLVPIDPSGNLEKAEIRQRHESRILAQLAELGESLYPQFLVLSGYKRIIGSTLLEAFRSLKGYSRIVNVHPSLLPAFPGLNSYAQAFHYGVKVTGVTVHLVEEGLDTGPICAQEAFSIADCTSEEEVELRGLKIEHRLFPQTLEWILKENFEITSREQKRKFGQSLTDLTERRLCVCPY